MKIFEPNELKEKNPDEKKVRGKKMLKEIKVRDVKKGKNTETPREEEKKGKSLYL